MRISRPFVGSGAVAWLACAAITSAPANSRAQSASIVRPLEYTRSVLPNGLVVIFNEDHSSPIVAIDVWYHIGAKDELPGHTGLAHLCEHLMGEGSPNVSVPQRVFLQSIGGTSSRWANTTEDITHYYYTVPRHQLEPALWAESDRMAAPLSRADAGRLGPVREVIKQERPESGEPGLRIADELTRAALFPETIHIAATHSGQPPISTRRRRTTRELLRAVLRSKTTRDLLSGVFHLPMQERHRSISAGFRAGQRRPTKIRRCLSATTRLVLRIRGRGDHASVRLADGGPPIVCRSSPWVGCCRRSVMGRLNKLLV
jgi:hypothetical protein